MSIVVVATARPLPEHRDAVIAAFERAIPLVHGEKGCERYALHESPDALVMIERWADGEATQGHVAGEPFKELSAALEGKLTSGLEVVVLTPHPAGTTEQGQI